MASSAAETVIGAAVLAVAGGFLFYAANTADLSVTESAALLTERLRDASRPDVLHTVVAKEINREHSAIRKHCQ